jgi:hypothetical protein
MIIKMAVRLRRRLIDGQFSRQTHQEKNEKNNVKDREPSDYEARARECDIPVADSSTPNHYDRQGQIIPIPQNRNNQLCGIAQNYINRKLNS